MVQPPELSLLSLLSATPDGSQKPGLPGTELFGNLLAHLQTLATTAGAAAGEPELLPTAAAIAHAVQQISLRHTAAQPGEVSAEGLPPTRPRQEAPEQQALESILQALQDILATLSLPATPLPTPVSSATPVPTEARTPAALPANASVPVALSSLPATAHTAAHPTVTPQRVPAGQQTAIDPTGQTGQGASASFDIHGSRAAYQQETAWPEMRTAPRAVALPAAPQQAAPVAERQGEAPAPSMPPGVTNTPTPAGLPGMASVPEPDLLPSRFPAPASIAPPGPGRPQVRQVATSSVERMTPSPIHQPLAVPREGEATAAAIETLGGGANGLRQTASPGITTVTPHGVSSGIPPSGPMVPAVGTNDQRAVLSGMAKQETLTPSVDIATPPTVPHRRPEMAPVPTALAGAQRTGAPASTRPLVPPAGVEASASADMLTPPITLYWRPEVASVPTALAGAPGTGAPASTRPLMTPAGVEAPASADMAMPPVTPHQQSEVASVPTAVAGAPGTGAPASTRPLMTPAGVEAPAATGTVTPLAVPNRRLGEVSTHTSPTGLPHQTVVVPGENTVASANNARILREAAPLTGGIPAPAGETAEGQMTPPGYNTPLPHRRTDTLSQTPLAPGRRSAGLTADIPEFSTAPGAIAESVESGRDSVTVFPPPLRQEIGVSPAPEARAPQTAVAPRVGSQGPAGDAPEVATATPVQDIAMSGDRGQGRTQVLPASQPDTHPELPTADALPLPAVPDAQAVASTQQEPLAPQATAPQVVRTAAAAQSPQAIPADAPVHQPVLTGSDEPPARAAEEVPHHAITHTAPSPTEMLSSAPGERQPEEQADGQQDAALYSNQNASSSTDSPGATGVHLAEGVGRAVPAEAAPRSFTPEEARQDTPRAVPLSPESAARVLGRPLPHGTVLLQLNPPELGYMQVQVQLTDGHLSASFWADSPEVRTLLQTHFPTLQHNLNGHGFQEHQISTTLAGGEFTGQAGQFAHQQASSQFFGQGREPGETLGQGHRAPPERAAYRGTTRNGLVDVTI